MVYENGGTYDPSGGRRDLEKTGQQGEVVPWESGALGTSYPGQPQLPAVGAPKPPIPVQRRTLLIMTGTIMLLLVLVGVLLFAALGSNGTPSAVAALTSTSAAAAGPTDTASSSPSPEPSPSPSDTSAGIATATDSSSATAGPSPSFSGPFGSQPLGNPVDSDGNVSTNQDVHISNTDYPVSIGFYCPTGNLIDWDVAGFSTFTAVFGIPDDARSATGVTNAVTFADQNGRQLGTAKASIGQPAQIQLALKGATRLEMSCDRQGSNDSTNNYVAFGNATISTS